LDLYIIFAACRLFNMEKFSRLKLTGTIILLPKSSIAIASIDCACHREVVATIAISSEKVRLLRFTRNDNPCRRIRILSDVHL
jgi:hypothetical protein